MATGLPFVGTDNSGIREAVGPSGLAYLAPPEDHQALASRILSFILDEDLRIRVGRINEARARSEFGARKMGERTAAYIAKRLPVHVS
jgi:glycosyltransferase involved in cell wall biosynthesis